MVSDPKIHSFDEVVKHNKIKDCWLIISGKVYDVTPFMDEHPGGDDVMLSSTGKDATNDFEDVGHREQMKQFYIGVIDASTFPSKQRSSNAAVPSHQHHHDETSFGIKILQFLLPLIILGLAVVIRKYTKQE